VIGVAKDVRQRGVGASAGGELYLSLDQHRVAPPTMNVVMRTTSAAGRAFTDDPASGSRSGRRGSVVRLRDMDSVFEESIRRPRVLAQLLGVFGGLALLLAAIARMACCHTWSRAPARDWHTGRPWRNERRRSHADSEARASSHDRGCRHWHCGALVVNRLIASCFLVSSRLMRHDRRRGRDSDDSGGGDQLAAGVARLAPGSERRSQRFLKLDVRTPHPPIRGGSRRCGA
jgi:hypothetical protein